MVNNSINTDPKNMFACLYDLFCNFESSQIQFYLHPLYSIILYRDYLNKRKKYFEKIFNCLRKCYRNIL